MNTAKQKADPAGTESTKSFTGLSQFGNAKLLKISFDTKFKVQNFTFWMFQVIYEMPSGHIFIRNFRFLGSLSYRQCLCEIPQSIPCSEERTSLSQIPNVFNNVRNN